MRAALRYFPLYFRDHVVTRGVAMTLVGIVFLLPIIAAPSHGSTATLPRALAQYLRGSSGLFTLVATFGIVGGDQRQAFYRFLFAKPVSPVAYYALAFCAAGVTFVLVNLLMLGIVALFVTPFWNGAALLDAVVEFVLVGALVFALSRFTRLDWLLALFVMGIASFLRSRFPPHASALGAVLNVVFPPTGTETYFPGGTHPAWGALAWALGYAAVMLGLGLAAVRFMSFGSSR